jgi:hypothetical protein
MPGVPSGAVTQGATMRYLDELILQVMMGFGVALAMIVLVMAALF